VKSPRARSKIRQWFTKERREEAIERGKEQIAKLMRKEGVPLKRVLSHESLSAPRPLQAGRRVGAVRRGRREQRVAQAVVRRVIEPPRR
jgi:GTP pyrophosphokinase